MANNSGVTAQDQVGTTTIGEARDGVPSRRDFLIQGTRTAAGIGVAALLCTNTFMPLRTSATASEALDFTVMTLVS